jgi:hypothetical protein
VTSKERLQRVFRHQEPQSVPPNVGLEDFRQVAELVKQTSARPVNRGRP